MLFLSIFLAGFTLGVFAALKIFAPEQKEELWDPQNFPVSETAADFNNQIVISPKSKNLISLKKS